MRRSRRGGHHFLHGFCSIGTNHVNQLVSEMTFDGIISKK